MTAFWLVSAALAFVAVASIAWPLLHGRARGEVSRGALNVSVYRDQLRELEADRAAGLIAEEDYARARGEIERRVLEDAAGAEPPPARRAGRRLALVAAGVPLLAIAVYIAVGNPGALTADPQAQARITPQQVEEMVERLASRLKESPQDGEGWRLLGRAQMVLGRYAESADAYAKAAARAPRDPQVLADFADALAMARGQSMQGEPEELVRRALELDPKNLKALALAGTAAFERKDFAAAAGLWERMLALVPAGSEDARSIAANIEEARTLAKSGAGLRALRGVVELDPKLRDRVSPEDRVFVFARATEGPGMPLAVQRARVRDLPLSFALDDSMAMTPAARLSGQRTVVVGARISKRGEAKPAPGDLQGLSAPVPSDAQQVKILIDSVVR